MRAPLIEDSQYLTCLLDEEREKGVYLTHELTCVHDTSLLVSIRGHCIQLISVLPSVVFTSLLAKVWAPAVST